MLTKRFRTSRIEVLKSSTPEGLPLIKNAIAVKEVKPTKEVKEAVKIAAKSIYQEIEQKSKN